MNRCDTKWREDALRECWAKQMTPLQCAEHIGIARSHVYSILSGKAWRSIRRPEGFVYPFPSQPKRRTLTVEEKAEALHQYVERRMTRHEFAELVGINSESACVILNGYRWRDIARPAGFQYPWPDPV